MRALAVLAGVRKPIFMERVGTAPHQGPRSSSVTRAPASAKRAAATEPPKPLPMTTSSTFGPGMFSALFACKPIHRRGCSA